MDYYVDLPWPVVKRGYEAIFEALGHTAAAQPLPSTILITTKTTPRPKTVVVFSHTIEALTSPSPVRLSLMSSEADIELALNAVVKGASYTAEDIRNEEVSRKAARELLYTLSPRERAFITYIREGASNKVIAKALYLSEKTVKNNLTALYCKLAVKNRGELIKKCKNLLTDE
ncbi:LuxR C-terminal-related transcriptional regulator [Peptoniphilus equinus]|uniref:LuxR C-terminal-related transcriptional regulator n=1 Tax=Peptoniphilus equinus TaxID=3016343 RepID=A0ABY7QV57_9FIRM|nr:LuxR C-terminal-related transcriptional regulator [Peptoniphilus equinus]WBW50221.1 LuxR C-terminal-related transcriptional regulator [Peptoniphilus equinus]